MSDRAVCIKGLCTARSLYRRTKREDPTLHLARRRLGSVINLCDYYDIPVQMEGFGAGTPSTELPRTWPEVLEMVHRQWEAEWADTSSHSSSTLAEDIQQRVIQLLSSLVSYPSETRLWESEKIPVHKSALAHRQWVEHARIRVSLWWMWEVFIRPKLLD